MNQQITDDEGAKMIIALQAMSGIEEPADRALRNWQAFSNADKTSTATAYEIFCKVTR